MRSIFNEIGGADKRARTPLAPVTLSFVPLHIYLVVSLVREVVIGDEDGVRATERSKGLLHFNDAYQSSIK